jgi:hypothetical protein
MAAGAAAADSTAVEVAADITAVEVSTAEVADTTEEAGVTTVVADATAAIMAVITVATADTMAATAVIIAATAVFGDTPVSESPSDTGLAGASALASVGEDIGQRIRMVMDTAARGRNLIIRPIPLTPTPTLRRLTCQANRTFPTGHTFPTRAGTIRMLTLRQRNRVLPRA